MYFCFNATYFKHILVINLSQCVSGRLRDENLKSKCQNRNRTETAVRFDKTETEPKTAVLGETEPKPNRNTKY